MWTGDDLSKRSMSEHMRLWARAQHVSACDGLEWTDAPDTPLRPGVHALRCRGDVRAYPWPIRLLRVGYDAMWWPWLLYEWRVPLGTELHDVLRLRVEWSGSTVSLRFAVHPASKHIET